MVYTKSSVSLEPDIYNITTKTFTFIPLKILKKYIILKICIEVTLRPILRSIFVPETRKFFYFICFLRYHYSRFKNKTVYIKFKYDLFTRWIFVVDVSHFFAVFLDKHDWFSDHFPVGSFCLFTSCY